MAYVPIPKDLSNIKTKIAFGLTGRQLGYFSIALILGVPAYAITLSMTDNSTIALVTLIIVALPFVFFALFKKDGLTGEQWLKQMLKVKFKRNPLRVYRNDNHYRFIQQTIKKEKGFVEDTIVKDNESKIEVLN